MEDFVGQAWICTDTQKKTTDEVVGVNGKQSRHSHTVQYVTLSKKGEKKKKLKVQVRYIDMVPSENSYMCIFL